MKTATSNCPYIDKTENWMGYEKKLTDFLHNEI